MAIPSAPPDLAWGSAKRRTARAHRPIRIWPLPHRRSKDRLSQTPWRPAISNHFESFTISLLFCLSFSLPRSLLLLYGAMTNPPPYQPYHVYFSYVTDGTCRAFNTNPSSQVQIFAFGYGAAPGSGFHLSRLDSAMLLPTSPTARAATRQPPASNPLTGVPHGGRSAVGCLVDSSAFTRHLDPVQSGHSSVLSRTEMVRLEIICHAPAVSYWGPLCTPKRSGRRSWPVRGHARTR